MKSTGSPNKGHLAHSVPRVSAERALECAGRCGLVSQLSQREAQTAAQFTCSTCRHDGRAVAPPEAPRYRRLEVRPA